MRPFAITEDEEKEVLSFIKRIHDERVAHTREKSIRYNLDFDKCEPIKPADLASYTSSTPSVSSLEKSPALAIRYIWEAVNPINTEMMQKRSSPSPRSSENNEKIDFTLKFSGSQDKTHESNPETSSTSSIELVQEEEKRHDIDESFTPTNNAVRTFPPKLKKKKGKRINLKQADILQWNKKFKEDK